MCVALLTLVEAVRQNSYSNSKIGTVAVVISAINTAATTISGSNVGTMMSTNYTITTSSMVVIGKT